LYKKKQTSKQRAAKGDDKHMPKPSSSCIGDYGPEKKRKDGTFYLRQDYNMSGIAHVPMEASVS